MNAPRPHSATVLPWPWNEAARTRIVRALREGSVMTYPSETSYALGGNALLPAVAQAVYGLKGRPADKALLLLVDGAAGLAGWARDPSPVARALMARCWPGPLTLVFHAGESLPAHLADARGTVALRWSPHPLVAELLRLGGVPLIGTSANRSGAPGLHTVQDVLAALPTVPTVPTVPASAGGIALALDGGPSSGGAPSTIVDTTLSPPRVLREGALSRIALQTALRTALPGSELA